MNIKIDNQGSDAYIHNLAFVKAILKKEYVQSLPITKTDKENILKSILQLLKNS